MFKLEFLIGLFGYIKRADKIFYTKKWKYITYKFRAIIT